MPTALDRDKTHAALLEETRSADAGIVTRAVRHCTEHLRERTWEPSLVAALVARFVELAAHENARPRQAVAEALAYLPDDVYAALQPRLAEDMNLYVRGPALEAPAKRATKKREAAQRAEGDEDARAAAYYAKLRPAERRIAGWIAELHTEFYVRREHHEVDNALVAAEGSLARLEQSVQHPEIARLRDHIEAVRRIHEDARTNARAVAPEYRLENLRAIVVTEAEDLPLHYPDRKERLDVDLSGVDRRLELMADAGRLREAFRNLLRNAVEAYGEGAPRIRVAVSAFVAGTDAVVVFADDGVGMSEEQLARAFVPFRSRKKGGTGFGLRNARRVARQYHGGDLRIVSTEGVGTTVTMTLPLVQEEPKKRKRARK